MSLPSHPPPFDSSTHCTNTRLPLPSPSPVRTLSRSLSPYVLSCSERPSLMPLVAPERAQTILCVHTANDFVPLRVPARSTRTRTANTHFTRSTHALVVHVHMDLCACNLQDYAMPLPPSTNQPARTRRCKRWRMSACSRSLARTR
jgi:hypothetical protein